MGAFSKRLLLYNKSPLIARRIFGIAEQFGHIATRSSITTALRRYAARRIFGIAKRFLAHK
jgi:hypothetical protein